MSRTLEQLAKEANDVQDACNLCAVAQSFARAIRDLRHHCPSGTDELNRHPITRLWLHKMCDLAGIPGDVNNYSDEWAAVLRMIDNENYKPV